MAEQYHSVPALIRNLCCNYDRRTGGCLLLDHGEVVQCPQLYSPVLQCRYFWTVLLEDPDSRKLKAEIMGDDHIKACEECGRLFRAVSTRATRCTRCYKKAKMIERGRSPATAKADKDTFQPPDSKNTAARPAELLKEAHTSTKGQKCEGM